MIFAQWMHRRWLLIFSRLFWLVLVSVVWSSPSVSFAGTDCDRLCKAQWAVRLSPSPAIVDQFGVQMEAWASLLMEISDAPTYLTYMDSYQLMAAKDLSQYGARYLRRKLRGKELTELFDHLKDQQAKGLAKQLSNTLTADEAEVDAYIRKLMWVRMREARRYLIRRLDEVYGLSRLSYLLRYESREFVGQYMLQQAERWSVGVDRAELKSFQDQINEWLMSEIDVDPSQFQTKNYHQVISRLTYVLRNVSDQELREAISYYQHPNYQVMLELIEKAWTLHFQRLRVKNSLSDQDSPVQ
ncbi:hypothetical protein [Litoribrevibacter albus]|uniref:Uncharacterized protein n=1 Tax=Litoribrevibacter albus TaxID=1473156 RepID=A0AA37SEE7_9GAMM|nr:hypothetical protein [Litoribrevibacter albus]GLQ32991.1 hypothetical protein GCM10007876_34700 [Litoribrevibacter albus]